MPGHEFFYLDTRGEIHRLVDGDIDFRGTTFNAYYRFEVNPAASKVPIRLAFCLNELKRLHEHIGSVISRLEGKVRENGGLGQSIERANKWVSDHATSSV